MSNATPEAYWGEGRHGTGWLCGRCGQLTVAPEVGDSFAEVLKLIRAHQRSEVCG